MGAVHCPGREDAAPPELHVSRAWEQSEQAGGRGLCSGQRVELALGSAEGPEGLVPMIGWAGRDDAPRSWALSCDEVVWPGDLA